jgi:hypothetical protein
VKALGIKVIKMTEDEQIEKLAKELVGNWRKFNSFAWHDKPDDAYNWCIIYTKNRDSGLLDQSNHDVIEKALEAYNGWHKDGEDCQAESHNHWAVGHVDGFSIRVYKYGNQITEAFKVYARLAIKLEDYPILDEEDYYIKEYKETLDNINQSARGMVISNVPDGWESECYSWFSDNLQGAIESVGDQGGYPDKQDMIECLKALNFYDESND